MSYNDTKYYRLQQIIELKKIIKQYNERLFIDNYNLIEKMLGDFIDGKTRFPINYSELYKLYRQSDYIAVQVLRILGKHFNIERI